MIDIMADGKRWTNVDAAGELVNDPAELGSPECKYHNVVTLYDQACIQRLGC